VLFCLPGGSLQSENEAPSVETLVGWLLEHSELQMSDLSDTDSISDDYDIFSDSDGMLDDLEDMTNAVMEAQAPMPLATVYKKRADFHSNDDYAVYVRDHIQVGMRVKCCHSYEDVHEGDIGKVIKVRFYSTLL
jgi:E3 ubiquitin-protein ligase HERC2